MPNQIKAFCEFDLILFYVFSYSDKRFGEEKHTSALHINTNK